MFLLRFRMRSSKQKPLSSSPHTRPTSSSICSYFVINILILPLVYVKQKMWLNCYRAISMEAINAPKQQCASHRIYERRSREYRILVPNPSRGLFFHQFVQE